MANILLKIEAPNEYSGKQAIIKSDRILFNASNNDIILAAKNSIALAASNEIHINSAGNMYLNVKEGSKIVIGKSGTALRSGDQPSVLGDNQLDFLEDLLQLLITFQVVTPNGEGLAGPKVNAEIQKLKNKYLKKRSDKYILSDLLFIADNIK